MDRRVFLGKTLKVSLPVAASMASLGATKTSRNPCFEVSRRLSRQLGPGYHVLGIDRSYTYFVARIGFKNRVFFLKSRNGKIWQTMDFESDFGVSKVRV